MGVTLGGVKIRAAGGGGGLGPQGPQGEQGPQGPQGEMGAQGAQGMGASFPGPSTSLIDAAGGAVTVGSGLSLGGGTLSASGGGGGITQLTGNVLAGPGAGSQSSTVVGTNGENFVGPGGAIRQRFNADVDYLRMMRARGYVTAGDALTVAAYDAGSSVVYFGSNDSPESGTGIPNDTWLSGRIVHIAPNNRAALSTASLRNYSPYMNLSTIYQGVQLTRHERIGAGTFRIDNDSFGGASYYVEVAYPAESTGVNIILPATPWSEIQPATAGRTFVVADVLGTCSAADPITLSDPNGRTFNGVAGPYTITKPSNVCTITLDSTLNNWILGFQSGSPI